MTAYQSPRGTRDILPDQQPVWDLIKKGTEEVSKLLAYRPITVPSYEDVTLFQRAIGTGTDITDKELFLVRGSRVEGGEEQYALRPEATAGIVRAFVEHGMHTLPQPVKLTSLINCFRYDRPQKGRYREFYQWDLEYFGDKGPFADAWVIYTCWSFFQTVGLKNVLLSINTLGTPEERGTYIAALREYLRPHTEKLSEDSKTRLETNPLRILDSKDTGDKALLDGAPVLEEYLGEVSQAHFSAVLGYLNEWNIPYRHDPRLVRGLDYYSHTAFEWVPEAKGGQQDSFGGGGRFDGLLTQMGGADIGAVGAALGLDRIAEALEAQGIEPVIQHPVVYLVAADETGKTALLKIAETLRNAGIPIDANFSKEGVGAQMKAAARSGATYAVIVGESEVSSNTVTVKNLSSGEQETIATDQLATHVSTSAA